MKQILYMKIYYETIYINKIVSRHRSMSIKVILPLTPGNLEVKKNI